MSRRLWIAAIGLALAAIAWWSWPRPEPWAPAASHIGPVLPAADAAKASPDASRPHTFSIETRLLPHDGTGASPETVRIGIGRVSPDQTRAYERWVLSGEDGAGPDKYMELAEIEHWLKPPSQVREDRTVTVGPAGLPVADRYDLRATSTNPLVFYSASFTSLSAPDVVAPILAAGLTVSRAPQMGTKLKVQFRRVDEISNAARWQSLMTEHAPDLLAAFDEDALPLELTTHFAPLPPGPIELVLLVNGVEAERKRVSLAPGEWTEVRFDEVAQEVAQAVSADLELAFVLASTTKGIEGVTSIWHSERGNRPRTSDDSGTVRYTGVDLQRPQRFTLEFPIHNGELPLWPETQPLELTLDDDADVTRRQSVIRKTIELTPLRWLELRTGDFPVPALRQGGDPYPIFVLQQERDGQWTDVAADHFLSIPGGLAVSVQHEGRYRVMALRSPWSARCSTTVTVTPDSVSRFPVDLLPGTGRLVEISVQRDGVPLSREPIYLRGPARGLPGAVSITDSLGRLTLDGVTVAELRLEAPGYLAARVELEAASVLVNLLVDSEARSE